MRDVGPDEVEFEEDDARELAALGDRIDVSKREFAAVRDIQAEVMRLQLEAREQFYEREIVRISKLRLLGLE
jgi:hypothetical protein